MMAERKAKRGGAKERRGPRAVILYENSPAREFAFQFWKHFEQSHPTEPKLEVNWLPFARVSDPLKSGNAAEKAARADLIVFAMSLEGELPGDVKLWIESWLGKRREREGAIVGLVCGQSGPCATAGLKEIYLRHVALRAGMDYLSRTTPTAPVAMPNSLDSFCNRARQMTSVLDDILRTQFLPPGPPI